MSIDLDAARAARREAAGINPSVTFGGRDFVLPVELPIETTDWGRRITEAEEARDAERKGSVAWREKQVALTGLVTGFLRFLLADQADAFFALKPSYEDAYALLLGIPAEYGTSLGESRASRRSSKATPANSKRTSKLATA